MEISVVTSITGKKDDLIDSQKKGNADFVAFLDAQKKSSTWNVKKSYDRFIDPRRNSRIHKILIHQYVKTEYSIWIDGNIELLKPPEELIERYLKNHDIFFFNHQTRDCIYDEAITCAKSKLDNPEVIIEQVKSYEDRGFAKNKGLLIGNFIIRRHTPKVEAFNNAWWSEYCRHSVRDQIALPFAIHKTGLRVHSLDAPWVFSGDKRSATRGGVIRLIPHIILNPKINE